MIRIGAALAIFLLLSACGPRPPQELAGLWAKSAGACEAGIGLRFSPRGVVASFAGREEVLLPGARYRLDKGRYPRRLAIDYRLPKAGAPRGRIVLVLDPTGRLNPLSRSVVDPVTGSAYAPLRDGAGLLALFDVASCERASGWPRPSKRR